MDDSNERKKAEEDAKRQSEAEIMERKKAEIEVFSIRRRVYIDGVKVEHCGVVICKKTLDVNDPETWTFSLPDLDGSSKFQFQTEDVKKNFIYPEKGIVGFLFSSNNMEIERKSLMMEVEVS